MRRSISTVVVVLLALVSPPSNAAPPDRKADFLRWAGAVAREKKLSVCRAGRLRYPGESAAGYFAALGDAGKPDASQILVLSDGKTHWSYEEDETATLTFGCETPAAWQELKTLEVSSRGGASYIWDDHEITFVEGEPVTLHESHHDVDGGSETDWLKASYTREEWDRAQPEPTGHDAYGILVALPPGSRWLKRWKVPTFVAFGAKNRRGRKDADLEVRAIDQGPAGVQIVVDVIDDKPVPTPPNGDARQLVRSDHLELWWSAGDTNTDKQLGIGMLADGGVDVRWLVPEDSTEKPPVVRRSGAHFEIDLPLASLGVNVDPSDSNGTVPFTAAFSDADDPAAGQQTVVATSQVRRAKRETFGELYRLQTRARRFPLFGSPF